MPLLLPLWGIRPDGRCACGIEDCGSPGKHPSVESWDSVPPDWRPAPGERFAIRTGEVSGLFVVDLDVKDGKNGVANWYELGHVPTREVRTPSGGRHLYYRWPGFEVPCTRSAPASGVDLRGDGGYVVGPGVPGYVVTDPQPIADAPAWLLATIKAGTISKMGEDAPETGTEAWRIERGREFCEKLPAAIAGEGGHTATLTVAAFLRRKLCLPKGAAFDLLRDVYNPRCVPPWSEKELRHKVDHGGRLPWPVDTEIPSGVIDVDAMVGRNVTEAPTKKAKNTAHVYTCVVGESMPLSGKPSKIGLAELTGKFARHPQWAGSLRWNEFTQRPEAVDPPVRMPTAESPYGGIEDCDVSAAFVWLETQGYTAPFENVYRALLGACMSLPYHPVREYLEGLPPEGPEILETLATDILGAKDAVCNEMFAKFLIGSVRRILNPGCKFDTMLVLHGGQGALKSSFVAALFAPWNREGMPDLGGKDAQLATKGRWGIEIGELDTIIRAETQTTKDFLSRCVDTFRAPYGKTEVEWPRQCVFVGTTNDDDFLRDATGDRRFWPISIPEGVKVDMGLLAANRDRIWSAALQAAKAGVPHWFDSEASLEVVRQPFREQDAWTEAVEVYLAGQEWVTTADIYTKALFRATGEVASLGKREANRIGRTLRQLGCQYTVRDGRRIWKVPEKYSLLAAKAAPVRLLPNIK